MLELAARRSDPNPVRLKAIADMHGIPKRFLVQILLQLKTAGLVASVRGASGGYQLARTPESISLASIINAIDESSLAPRVALTEANRTPTVEVLRRETSKVTCARATVCVSACVCSALAEFCGCVGDEVSWQPRSKAKARNTSELRPRSFMTPPGARTDPHLT